MARRAEGHPHPHPQHGASRPRCCLLLRHRLDDDELSRVRGQKIGFVFQAFNLISELTIAENAEIPLLYQGIPAAERDKVFERFYRLDRSRGTTGSGLGLALVKAIASVHGLAIRLEDRNPGLAVILKGH